MRIMALGFNFSLLHFWPVLLWGIFFFHFLEFASIFQIVLFYRRDFEVELLVLLFVLKMKIKKKNLVFTLKLFCPYLQEQGRFGVGRGEFCLFYWHLSLWSRKVSAAYMININNDNKTSYKGFPLILYYSGSGA